jgi:hypothetical protein
MATNKICSGAQGFAKGWEDALHLADIVKARGVSPSGDALASLASKMQSDGEAWKLFYELEMPEESSFPSGLSEKLSAFDQLLVSYALTNSDTSGRGVVARMGILRVASVILENYVVGEKFQFVICRQGIFQLQ